MKFGGPDLHADSLRREVCNAAKHIIMRIFLISTPPNCGEVMVLHVQWSWNSN